MSLPGFGVMEMLPGHYVFRPMKTPARYREPPQARKKKPADMSADW